MSEAYYRTGRLIGFLVAISIFAAGLPVLARGKALQDLFSTSAEGSTQVVDHAAWDKLLQI
jgi:hypothetical protein